MSVFQSLLLFRQLSESKNGRDFFFFNSVSLKVWHGGDTRGTPGGAHGGWESGGQGYKQALVLLKVCQAGDGIMV